MFFVPWNIYYWRKKSKGGIDSKIPYLIPYVLEHMLDDIVPRHELRLIMIWGAVMIFIALWVRTLNVTANRMAVKIARNCIYDIRKYIINCNYSVK